MIFPYSKIQPEDRKCESFCNFGIGLNGQEMDKFQDTTPCLKKNCASVIL